MFFTKTRKALNAEAAKMEFGTGKQITTHHVFGLVKVTWTLIGEKR